MAGVFKAYDIRGLAPEQVGPELAERVGKAVAYYLSARRLVVGRDMRISSPLLAEPLIRGIRSMGCDVISLGLSSTPMTYFATASLGADGGVMVTASHNPKEYNGFKLCRQEAIPLAYDSGIAEIERLVGQDLPAAATPGRLEQIDLLSAFAKHVLSFARRGPAGRTLKVVVDAGNGMAGYVMPPVFRSLPVTLVPMYFELDGSFPHHPANPLEHENVRELERRVRDEGADLGIAFDGDADRVFFVTDRGRVVAADRITCLIARDVLVQAPATILYDLRSSRVVAEEVRAHGGQPVRCRVGHAYIKRAMREHGAAFAGELSGHFYFRGNWFADSGEIAAMHVLNVLARERGTFTELIAPLERYASTGEVNFRIEASAALLESLAAAYPGAEVTRLDGLSVDFPDWWFNIRESNTEPLIRLNLEARTAEERERHFGELCARIESHGGRRI